MVTYVIASKATQPFLPEVQMLGEFLEENCPDVTVQIVVKSNEDWADYIDSVSVAPLAWSVAGSPGGCRPKD